MESRDLSVYIPILILMVTATIMAVGGHLVSVFLAPKKADRFETKDLPYECGEEPQGSAWSMFNVRFYVVGLIFIIFDIESALLFPVAAIFKKYNDMGLGGVVLIEILIFILILVAGIAYCWRKGDLDWVKSYSTPVQGKQKKMGS